MKWTYEEILDRSDELADRFEAFDPDAAEEVPVAEYLLARAVRQRARVVATPGAELAAAPPPLETNEAPRRLDSGGQVSEDERTKGISPRK